MITVQRFLSCLLHMFSFRLLSSPSIAQELYEVSFLVRTKHKVNTLNLAHSFRLQLSVTTSYCHKSTRIIAHHTMYCLSALVVGNFCHRASIDKTKVSLLTFLCCNNTQFLQHLTECRCLGEVKFAAKRIISRLLILKN